MLPAKVIEWPWREKYTSSITLWSRQPMKTTEKAGMKNLRDCRLELVSDAEEKMYAQTYPSGYSFRL